jgi:GntR family transcriptional regulator/MocR family aminotransferase
VLPPATLLAPLATAKRDADGGCPVIEQQTLAQLIEMGAFDRHLRRARKTYRARRDALLSAVVQHLPDWSVAGAVAGLHVWLRPPSDVDAAALVSATAARGIAIEATAATSGRTDWLAGLVLCYARLDVDHAAEAVARIADAVRDIGAPTNRPGEVEETV